MLFHAFTIAGSRENCLNTRTIGRVLKHLPRDRAIVNAMKQTCVLVIFGLNNILFDKSQDTL